MKTIAVLPALNEEKHIEAVILEAKKHVDLVVVSDGQSTDKTRDIAHAAGADVICGQPGYGNCVRRGLWWARTNLGADVIVLLDSDGQHNPEEIPKLLALVFGNYADIVMGCRGAGMPAYRRFGNRVLTALCNIGANFKPYDAVTGYWAIRADKLPELTEAHWGVAIELLIKGRSNGNSMATVDVEAIYHGSYKENSHASPLKLGLNLLWYIIKWRFISEVLRR